jgi:ribosomal protein S4
MYGKKIKNLIYTNHRTSKIFNAKFDSLLRKLELRLNILLIRINFAPKLLISNQNILNATILVNGKKKHPNYQVRISDVISKKMSDSVNSTYRIKMNFHL